MILGVLLILLGIAVAVIGILAITKRLPGNKWIGIHVPEVRKSRELWDLAHRVASPSWLVSALAFIASGAISLTASGWMWFVVVGGVLAGMVMLGVGAAMGAHTVALYDAQRETAGDDDGGCGSSSGGCGCCSGGDDAPQTSEATASTSTSTAEPAAGATAASAGCCDSSAPAASGGCCDSTPEDKADDPAADCGVEGGCGSCALQGSCHPDDAGHPMNDPATAAWLSGSKSTIDMSAARNAAAQADKS